MCWKRYWSTYITFIYWMRVGSTTLETSPLWPCKVGIHISHDSAVSLPSGFLWEIPPLVPRRWCRLFIVTPFMSTTTMEITQMSNYKKKKKTSNVCSINFWSLEKWINYNYTQKPRRILVIESWIKTSKSQDII